MPQQRVQLRLVSIALHRVQLVPAGGSLPAARGGGPPLPLARACRHSSPTMGTTVRAYRAEDLGRILQLWERAGYVPLGPDGLTVDQAVDLMASGPAITLVAATDEGVVGMVAGAAIGAVGWI